MRSRSGFRPCSIFRRSSSRTRRPAVAASSASRMPASACSRMTRCSSASCSFGTISSGSRLPALSSQRARSSATRTSCCLASSRPEAIPRAWWRIPLRELRLAQLAFGHRHLFALVAQAAFGCFQLALQFVQQVLPLGHRLALHDHGVFGHQHAFALGLFLGDDLGHGLSLICAMRSW